MSSVDTALPYYARAAEAWEEATVLPPMSGSFGAFYTVPGAWYERFLVISYNIATDATAGNRSPVVEVRDANRRVICTVPSPINIPPSSSGGFSWQSTIPAVIAPIAIFQLIPFPSIYWPPGTQLFLDTVGGSAGDQYTGFALYSRRVPTGPEQAGTERLAAVPTPIFA